jgi:hypothetical protein
MFGLPEACVLSAPLKGETFFAVLFAFSRLVRAYLASALAL